MKNKRELIVDSFAGGGGASLGITWALDRGPDIAINHDAAAITMHAANHPETRHLTEDVWKVNPLGVTMGKPVGLLWASPDCKHFSRAKGSKPVEKKIRSLAWVVVKWAAEVQPRIIILENVREFADWGPLVPSWGCDGCGWRGTEGQAKLARRRRACPRCDACDIRESDEMVPDPDRKGLTFRNFVGRLRGRGYEVAWKILDAADFGAPTHRKRLFLIARRDGEPIVWPEPTHGNPKKIGRGLFDQHLKQWRTAAECIDWSLPCPSIFERKRPLAEATQRRIAHGIKRYVLDNPTPFIVGVGGRMGQSPESPVDQPNNTVTAKNDRAVVVPYVVGAGGPARAGEPKPVDRPGGAQTTRNHSHVVTPLLVDMQRWNRAKELGESFGTITTQGNRFPLLAPLLVRCNHGGDHFRGQPMDIPLPALTFFQSSALITPFLAPLTHQGAPRGQSPEDPLPTCTTAHRGETALFSPVLIQTSYGERKGQAPRTLDLENPMGTAVAGGIKQGLVAAFMAKHYGGMVGVPVDSPVPTTTERGTQNQLVAANLVHLKNHTNPTGCDDPLLTAAAGGLHAALVYSFLVKYFGTAIGQPIDEPLGTATTKDRFWLVTVTINGEPYVIVDIGMRMLTPRELARGQGFPDDYKLTGSNTSQVARIGNSVCPVMAEVLVRANFGKTAKRKVA